MKRFTYLYFFGLICSLGMMTSCNPDDDTVDPTVTTSVPETYNFDNASYSGQLERLAMLGELTSYMKTANTVSTTLDAQKLADMYANANDPFTTTYGKQLENKTSEEGVDSINSWITQLVQASIDAGDKEGSNGVAGRLTSEANSTYLFNENGVEFTQMIEKGIMGACFYYQATSVYLADGEEGIGADNTTNVTDKDYTQREHHFDEAFGYFGAPVDLTAANISEKISNSTASYHAKYSEKAESGGLRVVDDIMSGFRTGRHAITQNDEGTMKSSRDLITKEWEEIIASGALHYINNAKGDDYTDLAARCHQLSEAKAFVWSLFFNARKMISISEINEILGYLGDNFYTVSQANLQLAADKIAEVYGISGTVQDAI